MYYKLDPETKLVFATDMDGYIKAHDDWESRIVKQEQVGPWFISTVFLGLCRRFGASGGPIVFETMVFDKPNPLEDYCDRYSTWSEALDGHERAKAIYAERVAESEKSEALDRR